MAEASRQTSTSGKVYFGFCIHPRGKHQRCGPLLLPAATAGSHLTPRFVLSLPGVKQHHLPGGTQTRAVGKLSDPTAGTMTSGAHGLSPGSQLPLLWMIPGIAGVPLAELSYRGIIPLKRFLEPPRGVKRVPNTGVYRDPSHLSSQGHG